MHDQLNTRFAIPGSLQFVPHSSGLVLAKIETEHCSASMFLLGAHVASFHPHHLDQPLLFMSQHATYQEGKPIRGGVPICFPWFGGKASDPQAPSHGTVRTRSWDVVSTGVNGDGAVEVQMRLMETDFHVVMTASFGRELDMELAVSNPRPEAFACEQALHTYFSIGDVHQVEITGLERSGFRDQLTGQIHPPTQESIRFADETDRVYQGPVSTIRLRDPVFERTTQIQPRNSHSTVVWNPWIAKSKRLSDFGDDEYLNMCCIETANVGTHGWIIQPGTERRIGVRISSQPF